MTNVSDRCRQAPGGLRKFKLEHHKNLNNHLTYISIYSDTNKVIIFYFISFENSKI